MSTVIEGVYKQAGQADTLVPLSVDATGRLNTTSTATVSSEVEIKNDAGNPLPVNAVQRTCLGRQTLSVTTSAVATLTVPANAVAAMLQVDGSSAVSITLDGSTNPTASVGSRLDDGVFYYVDTPLANVKLIARTATTNVQVAYFDKV